MSVTVFWCEWDKTKIDSHELLRLALEQYLGQRPIALAKERKQMNQESAIPFSMVKTEKGKPYFENFPQVKFSISHSGNLWACAFGETEVGLDLQSEYMKNGEKIARRFFHPEEIAWLEKNGFAQFSRVWTHKESCVKFTGAGLAEGLDYFSVVPWLEENEWKCSRIRMAMDGVSRGRESGSESFQSEEYVNQKIRLEKVFGQEKSPETAENEVCDGNARFCQQEIPFREGFWMVLTSGEPQEIVVRQLSGSFLETVEYLVEE